MKNILSLIVVLLITGLIYSQDSDKIKYKANKIEMVFVKDNEEISKKPYGKDVTIVYDKFWKSFMIYFSKEFNEGYTNLKYVEDFGENKLGKVMKMTTGINNEDIVYVTDGIKKNGILLILVVVFENGVSAYLSIKNIKLKQ